MEPNPKNRIHVVDALRGFALMGLFLVHMASFYGLHWIDPQPSTSYDVAMWLFGGKSYALFSLLFGTSFFIIMNSQARKNVDFRDRFFWRMLVLFVLGYLHSLFYSADILQVLAICGVILVIFYPLTNKMVLAASLFFLLQIPTIGFLVYLAFNPEQASFNPTFWGYTAVSNEVAASAGFIDVIQANAYQSQFGKWWFYLETGRFWNILGFSLLGLWLGRIGFFTHFNKHTRANISFMMSALVIFCVMYFIADFVNQNPGQQPLTRWSVNTIIWSLANAGLMLFATVLFVFCFQHQALEGLLRHLAPCGRMTLTLYVAQSLLFAPIFFGYGLGLYNTISHDTTIILFMGLWLGQMLFARQWFKYYQFGPLEWLWRSATYTRADIPFRVVTK